MKINVNKLVIVKVDGEKIIGEKENNQIFNAMTLNDGLTHGAMVKYCHKNRTNLLEEVELGNASFRTVRLIEEQRIQFSAIIAEFEVHVKLAINNLEADFAVSRMGK